MVYNVRSELMRTQRPIYIRCAQYYSLSRCVHFALMAYLSLRLSTFGKYFGFGLKEENFFFLSGASANALACSIFTPFPITP